MYRISYKGQAEDLIKQKILEQISGEATHLDNYFDQQTKEKPDSKEASGKSKLSKERLGRNLSAHIPIEEVKSKSPQIIGEDHHSQELDLSASFKGSQHKDAQYFTLIK